MLPLLEPYRRPILSADKPMLLTDSRALGFLKSGILKRKQSTVVLVKYLHAKHRMNRMTDLPESLGVAQTEQESDHCQIFQHSVSVIQQHVRVIDWFTHNAKMLFENELNSCGT